VITIVGLAVSRLRFRPLLISFVAVGAAIALYNYARFDNPFEFGLRYLLTGPNQNRIRLTAENAVTGLYYFLFCDPDFGPVFPWIRLPFRYPFGLEEQPFPEQYFYEPTAGALWIAPFLAGAAVIFFRRGLAPPVRLILWILLLSSAAIVLFLAATGFTTQRYEVDFIPMAALAAVAGLGTVRRPVFQAVVAGAIVYSAVANLALGIAGPYDEMLKNKPATYVRLAGWFSPIERFRPALNPAIDIRLRAEFRPQPDGVREPLLTIGQRPYRYFLYAEHLGEKIKIVSQTDSSTMSEEIERAAGQPTDIDLAYEPSTGVITTAVNQRKTLAHPVGTLVTAPSQMTAGANLIDQSVTRRHFTGRIGIRSEP